MITATAEQAEIIANTPIASSYFHMKLACSPLAATARPGQFFQLLCPEGFFRRPMSVYAANPAASQVEFLYKTTGTGTNALATLRPHHHLHILGPLGRGFRIDPAWKHLVVVGRGAGLATLAPLAAPNVTAILSARTPALMVSEARFRDHGATVITVTDAQGTSGPAHVESLLRRLIAEHRCDALLSCGSARLLRVQQRLAQECAIPGQVALEQQMACGLGMCFCCVCDFNIAGTITHKRVCWDGPVFDMQQAMP